MTGNVYYIDTKWVNPFQPSVAFHMETSYLFCRAKQMNGFYMKHNTGLKRVKHNFVVWVGL